jgi:lytic cellulose monooxygenase (C1-hydroxylating)
VKIEQLSYNPAGKPPWASDLLREQGAKWSVTIPSSLAPGEYLLRHEILGLHVADKKMGAQFYPSCTQIRVVQGGNRTLPDGIALPGAYDPDDAQGVGSFSCCLGGVGLSELQWYAFRANADMIALQYRSK